MNGRNIARSAIFSLAVVVLPIQPWSAGWCAAGVAGKSEDLEVTPSLVREIQFMLLRLGTEPGPIDGVIGPQTTRAWRKFQQDTGLPQVDLVNGGKIPAAALSRLRSEASR
ncbi:MAG TPA: peptidoglycan-binding domain-containing protein, partial [Bradyrhizobium sp.]|nr:peptidoglycan-binding domain-containing protein [Bradyrhizobium sp.]